MTSCGLFAAFSRVLNVVLLEELVDTAAAQASRSGNLPNGEAGVRRGDDGPDTRLFSLMQPRRRQSQAFFDLLFVLEALSAFFSGVHTLRIRALPRPIEAPAGATHADHPVPRLRRRMQNHVNRAPVRLQ